MNQPYSDTATHEAEVSRTPALPEVARLLLVISTADATQAFELGAPRTLTLGRAEPADVRLPDLSLSRLHARFAREGELVRVTDLGSRNGTWLRGERIVEAVLRPGDSLVVGSATVSVQLAVTAGTALLGVLGGSAIVQHIHDEWTRAATLRRPLSVLAVRALARSDGAIPLLARTCLEKLRPVDRAGLYDRDSLLIALPELRASEAARLALQLCGSLPGRLACGVATFPDACSTPEQLVSAAFRAVQDAKPDPRQPVVVSIAPDALHVRESGEHNVIRKSSSMLELARLIERLAVRPLSVLIHGETGSGKELVARELHQRSPRASAPLKVVNCAAIPDTLIESALFGHEKGSFTGADREHKGVFEQAHSGTVFLDEVGELSAEAQAALLRVLDSALVTRVGGTKEIAVDVRIVAATHRDLRALTETGAFRLDLYHRLNGATLEVPPLRERIDEIEPLVQCFLESTARRWGGTPLRIDAAAIERLCGYRWPGNVRELRNVIERAVALADDEMITLGELPDHICSQTPSARSPSESGTHALRTTLHDHEAGLIRDALEKTGGNQRKAAELLRLPLRTFQRRVSQLGLTRDKHG